MLVELILALWITACVVQNPTAIGTTSIILGGVLYFY